METPNNGVTELVTFTNRIMDVRVSPLADSPDVAMYADVDGFPDGPCPSTLDQDSKITVATVYAMRDGSTLVAWHRPEYQDPAVKGYHAVTALVESSRTRLLRLMKDHNGDKLVIHVTSLGRVLPDCRIMTGVVNRPAQVRETAEALANMYNPGSGQISVFNRNGEYLLGDMHYNNGRITSWSSALDQDQVWTMPVRRIIMEKEAGDIHCGIHVIDETTNKHERKD